MRSWKRIILPAILVTVAVVMGTLLVFRLTLGTERMPGSEVFVMFPIVCFSLFVCTKVASEVIEITKNGSD